MVHVNFAGRLRFIFLALAFLCCLQLTAVAQETSASNQRLKDALKKYPQADRNKDGVLTLKEVRAFQQRQKAAQAVPPTHVNLRYGPHQRNVLDLWIVENESPTPLLICIHGGGFSGGDKSSYHRQGNLIKTMHSAGISVATINYRLTEGGKNAYPAPMLDGARAVQFLRYKSADYNLDPTRFGATGGSAGGCMLMWLGFHDDLAAPDSKDPVLRHSTRLQALAPVNGPTCLHPTILSQWFQVASLKEHPAARPLFGIPPDGDLLLNAELEQKVLDASPISHLSSGDPACYMLFGANSPVSASSKAGLWVHHPVMGFKLQDAMEKLGLECHVEYKGGPKISDFSSQHDFLIKKLIGPARTK
jgi:acetyl esterase/lipase